MGGALKEKIQAESIDFPPVLLYDIPVQRTTPSAQPPIKAFSTSATKKDPHPFWSGRFFIARKAFWKNQVEGALKRKKGSFENGIEMLYPHAHTHGRTRTRATAGTVDRAAPRHASTTGTAEPTQADEHTDGTQTPATGAKEPTKTDGKTAGQTLTISYRYIYYK